MCGRTIRVPLLDGSVQPLPNPELNLKDDGLASALDKLAALVSKPGGDTSAQGSEAAAQQAEVLKSAAADAPQPIPLPEPIELAPAPEPVAVPPEQERPGSPGSETSEADAARRADAALQSLATSPPVESAETNRSSGRSSSRFVSRLITAGLLLCVGFAGGFVVGRGGTPGDSEPASVTSVESPEPEPPPAIAPIAGDPALTGRLSYVDAAGEVRPDAGARVLVLPEERVGSAHLAVEGFRSGASAADHGLAVASLRALGGDFALANPKGTFTVELPQPGLYQLLLLSRYQARVEDEPPDADAVQLLQAYFDRPAQVIGEAVVHLSPFRYRGSGSTRDHTFERP